MIPLRIHVARNCTHEAPARRPRLPSSTLQIYGQRMRSVFNARLITLILLAQILSARISHAQLGTIVAWGRNTTGELAIPASLGAVRQVAAGGDWHGGYTTCLRSDGSVISWGSNLYEVLNTPTDLEPCRAISAGWYHIMVLTDSNTVRAWGYMGTGERYWSVPSNLGPCVSIAAGYLHSLAIRSDGTVCAWGTNDYGGASTVPTDLGTCQDIAASYYYSTAVTMQGTMRSWGSNECGQMNIPADLLPCKRIAAGAGFQLALQVNGAVRAWGDNRDGQCNVPSDLRECTQVATGLYHSLALQSDGAVRAWGLNSHLQVSVPATLAQASIIAAGGYHSVALAPSPVVLAVQPISGPAEGGTRVTVIGNYFQANSRVWFDDAEATNVVVESATRIQATTPTGFPGESTVTVDTGSTRAFYYRPYCGSDLDQNGVVDGGDMSILLLEWGDCYAAPSTLAAPAPTPLLVPDESTPAPTPPAPQSARPTPQPRGTAS